ncbi:hypothetical protein PINS_up019071, partial [Pythium insidiosum]
QARTPSGVREPGLRTSRSVRGSQRLHRHELLRTKTQARLSVKRKLKRGHARREDLNAMV